jgi:hypothetical protein
MISNHISTTWETFYKIKYIGMATLYRSNNKSGRKNIGIFVVLVIRFF